MLKTPKLLIQTFICAGLLASAGALAETPSSPASGAPQVDVEPLVRRAFESTYFILLMAGTDASFRASLNPAELDAYGRVTNIARSANLRTWLRSRGVHDFGDAERYRAVYVMADTQQGVEFSTPVRIDMEFSDNAELFRLPGQPERKAVTSSDVRDPVYFNRPMLSRPDLSLTFAEGVGLSVHELGNKDGPQRDQASIDSLAAKIQTFVERHTRDFDTSRGRVSVTSLPRNQFETWFQLSTRTPNGSPIGTLSQLRIMGDQGLYVFVRDQSSVREITPALRSTGLRTNLWPAPFDSQFQWLEFAWSEGLTPRVTETDGQLRLEMSMTTSVAHLAFAHAGSPDPRVAQPGARGNLFPNLNFTDRARVSWSIDLTQATPTVQREWRRDETREDPSVRVEKIRSGFEGRDLVMRYRLPSTYRFADQGDAEFRVQPYLVLRYQGRRIEVSGRLIPGTTDQFEFRLASPEGTHAVEVIGLELGELHERLMLSPAHYRIGLLLPSIERFQLASSRPETAFRLQTMQIWNGTRWISLQRQTSGAQGSRVRLVFDSQTELTSLTLQQSWHAQVTIQDSRRILSMTRAVNEKNIVIPLDQLRQTLVGERLLVEFEVDAGMLLSERSRHGNESSLIDIQPTRWLTAISASNASLQTYHQELTSETSFTRIIAPSPPDRRFRARATNRPPVIHLRDERTCKDLF